MEFFAYGTGVILLAVGVHYLFHLRSSRRVQVKMNSLGDRLHEIR